MGTRRTARYAARCDRAKRSSSAAANALTPNAAACRGERRSRRSDASIDVRSIDVRFVPPHPPSTAVSYSYITKYFLMNKYLVTLTNISTYLAVAPGLTHPAVTHGHTELEYERS